jgi:uncharacterized protein (TIGR03435 family)
MRRRFDINSGVCVALGFLWLVTACFGCAQAVTKTDMDLAFEAATIKPAAPSPDGHTHIIYPDGGRFSAINITLLNLTEWAYDMPQKQILDGPFWMGSARFDLQATTDAATDAMLRAMSSGQDRMVQRLLEDRFSMKLHRETRVLPAYDLVTAKGGSKLTVSQVNGKSYGGGRAYLYAEGITAELIAEQLSQIVGRIVVDKTGLDGRYDFKLKWTPDDALMSEDSSPELFTAIEEQLGLQLKPTKEPVTVLVVDHIEPPSPN